MDETHLVRRGIWLRPYLIDPEHERGGHLCVSIVMIKARGTTRDDVVVLFPKSVRCRDSTMDKTHLLEPGHRVHPRLTSTGCGHRRGRRCVPFAVVEVHGHAYDTIVVLFPGNS